MSLAMQLMLQDMPQTQQVTPLMPQDAQPMPQAVPQTQQEMQRTGQRMFTTTDNLREEKMKRVFIGIAALVFGLSLTAGFAADCNFVGSKESDKYHTPACGAVKNIKAENKVCFQSAADAKKQGYTACGLCKPGEAKIVASKSSNKYHLSGCGAVKNIDKENLVEFKSAEDAVKAGYTPCGLCNPPKGSSVKEEKVEKVEKKAEKAEKKVEKKAEKKTTKKTGKKSAE